MRRGLVLALIMLLSGLAGWWMADWKGTGPSAGQTYRLYLLDNGFHTDLAVPRALLMADEDALSRAVTLAGAGDWVLIGWGDQFFYQSQAPIRTRLPDGARALFWPGGSPAVLQVDPFRTHPKAAFGAQASEIGLDEVGAMRLRARILQSLISGSSGQPILTGRREAYAGDDAAFFASSERFSIFFLCNHWMASVLHAGGLDMPVGRALLSSQVVGAVERQDHRQTGLEGAR